MGPIITLPNIVMSLCVYTYVCVSTYLRNHTRITTPVVTALCPELYPDEPIVTIKVKPIWILLMQETVSGSGISWALCKSAPRSRQITMPAPHRSVLLQARCPSWRQSNSAKALKDHTRLNFTTFLCMFPTTVLRRRCNA